MGTYQLISSKREEGVFFTNYCIEFYVLCERGNIKKCTKKKKKNEKTDEREARNE